MGVAGGVVSEGGSSVEGEGRGRSIIGEVVGVVNIGGGVATN